MAVPRKTSERTTSGRTAAPDYGKAAGAYSRPPAQRPITPKTGSIGMPAVRPSANATGTKTGRVPTAGGTLAMPKRSGVPAPPATPRAKGRALAVTRGKGKKRGLLGTQPGLTKKRRRR